MKLACLTLYFMSIMIISLFFVTVPENAVQRKLAFSHVLRGAVQSTVKREVKYHKKEESNSILKLGQNRPN